MTSHTYSNDDEDEDVAPALRLSQVSPDDPDEQAARLPSQGSALANITPNPRSNEQDDLTLPLGALSLPSDALNEQITKFHSEGLVPSAGGGASPRHGDNHELAQHLPQQLVGIVEVEDVSPVPELSDDASGSAPNEDCSQALALVQQGTSSLQRYEQSGVLAELVEGIGALSRANGLIPENHPMKPGCLTNLGTCFFRLFKHTGDVVDVDRAITAQQQAIRLATDGHSVKPLYLNNLGISLLGRFERLANVADLIESIAVEQQAVSLTPDGDPNKPRYLDNVGNSFLRRFEFLGDVADLDEAIMVKQQANHLTPDDDPRKPLFLSNLGKSLESRFRRLGDITDLNEAITAQRQAVPLIPDDHPDRAVCLNNLGNSFQSRFEHLGDISDLGEAITAQEQAVRLTPDDHPHKSACLNNLGNIFQSRFEHLGDVADLDEAITVQQRAVKLTPDDHPHKPACLSNLGISFESRFGQLGDIADLDQAVTAQQQAVRLTADGSPDKPSRLNNLGNSVQTQFERLGDDALLDMAIAVKRQAVRLTPDDHPEKPLYFSNLAISLRSQFERLGTVADLDEAITLGEQAVHPTLDGHPRKPIYLTNLGISLARRFQRLGNIADVDKAITVQQQAFRLTPDGHPYRPSRLNNLGASLLLRFGRLSDIADVNEAITAQQAVLRSTPDGHPDKPISFNNLGSAFLARSEHLSDVADLDEAITALRQAVRLTADSHPEKPMYLDGLGAAFRCRFNHLEEISDLDEATTAHQQAIRLTPDDHPSKPRYLSHLGISLQNRFERLGNVADIDEAITVQEHAIRLIPDGHPDKHHCLHDLGNSLRTLLARQPHEGISADEAMLADEVILARAVSVLSQSAKSSSSPPSARFEAASAWASLCYSDDEILDAYATLIDLLPRVVWLGRTIEQRYKDIPSIGDVVMDAAATAILLDEFNLALEWLEQGRSIVWKQLLQLRTPLENLRHYHPHEADELEKISRALESASMVQSQAHSGIVTSQEEIAQAHRRRAEEYDRIMERIRSFPNFSDFLLPKKSAYLCNAAVSGPVVIVNVHATRCDALILRPHSSQVHHVALPGLRALAASEMQLRLASLTRGIDIFHRHYKPYNLVKWPGKDTELPDLLGQLWLHVVEPVLHYLGLLQKPAANGMPHITWCLTGPLTFLPIHAAGLYGANDQPKIYDYVVSSYTPTLAALLSAKRPTEDKGTPRLLAVSQPKSPPEQPLPGTVREVNAIKGIHASTGSLPITHLNDREATVAAVLQGMKEHNWIHLACHGVQDAATATDSAFLLVDGRLTLKEIMKQSFSHTELAVLSACQTAKGDKELSEEAIHLAAGMLLAGYGSIVATMWSIGDDDGPIVAEKFYTYLITEARGDSARAAYALHHAVSHLRTVRGENDFASWVPFIHVGICSPSL